MTDSPTTADTARILAEFDRHLRVERGCSPHTVRAYLTDVRSLLDYLADTGAGGLEDLDLATLRGWLGTLHDAGATARHRPRAAAGHAAAAPPPARRPRRGPSRPRVRSRP